MCDFSGKLIAWMDRELVESEAAEMKTHLAACGRCRQRLAAYRQASGAFDAYCQAFAAAETRRPRAPRWAIAACGAVAAAAAMAALLVLPRARVAQAPSRVPGRAAALHTAFQKNEPRKAPQRPVQKNAASGLALHAPAAETARPAASATVKVRPRSLAPALRTEPARNETAATEPRAAAPGASAFPAEPPIEIAIPAEAMFPPGAVPPGASFTADLTIAADGSAQRLGLRPRLAGFERKVSQP